MEDRVFATEGLRKSQSISSTRRPFWARDTARFTETVVLPSPGMALETSRIFCPFSCMAFSTRRRSRRTDSEKPDSLLYQCSRG